METQKEHKTRIRKKRKKKKPAYTQPLVYIALVLLIVISTVWYLMYIASDQKELVIEDVRKLYFGKTPLYAEVADEPNERAQGLQFRDGLLENWGMLFVYDSERILEFWMKDTAIPLDIAYIDAEGTIREIHKMHPFDTKIFQSKLRMKYALEVNRGWFRMNGVKIGTKITNLE